MSELVAEASGCALVSPLIFATSWSGGVVDSVATTAAISWVVLPPAIDHNGLKTGGHGHLHCTALGFFQPLFLLCISEVRHNVVNGSLVPPPRVNDNALGAKTTFVDRMQQTGEGLLLRFFNLH